MKATLVFAPLGAYVSKLISEEKGLVRHLRTEVGMGAPVISHIKRA